MLITWLALGLSVLVFALMFLVRGGQNLLLYVSAYFLFFAFGPIVNNLLHQPIYEGIVVSRIPQASVGFTLALVGILSVDLLIPQRTSFNVNKKPRPEPVYVLLTPVLAAMTLYPLFALALAGPILLNGTKTEKIIALGPAHHLFLLAELCAISLYFIAKRDRTASRCYAANLTSYLVYCLVTNERDFIFILFVLLLVRQLLRGKLRLGRNTVIGSLCVYVAVLLAAARAGKSFDPTEVLNQGSILFVDTFIYDLVPSRLPFEYGYTYLNSALNLLPSSIYATDFNLAQWLKSTYAPTGTSGYGFSMSGEAYLNFGIIGIPAVFMLMAFIHRTLVNRLDQGDFYGYFATFFTTTWMYAVRGDSLMVLKSSLFAVIVYAVITSLRVRPSRRERVSHSNCATRSERGKSIENNL